MEINFRRTLSAFVALFGLLAILSVPTFGQSPLGRISGVVTDPSGAVVPNAKVTATNEETKQTLITTTSGSGSFSLAQVPVGFYTVKIEAPGMKSGVFTKVKVDTGLEYSMTAKLEVGAASETVEVVAGSELVNTSTSEISNTVAKEQIRDLPLATRNPLALITLQAGVAGIANRTNTVINGARPGWTQVTQDGINIQDNFIRVNGLDFVPNRPTSDNVGEFTITTNNLGADQAGGASQVKFTTEGGTNAYHGSLYEFNRNSKFAANSYANNNATLTCNSTNTADANSPCFGQSTVTPNNFVHNPIKKPFLNRNQFGGRIGGPVLKNKLFFFGYYERFWEVRQVSASKTIPLYDTLLTGEFRYRSGAAADGPVQSVNVLTLAGMNPSRAITGGPTTTPVRAVDAQVQSIILSKISPASNVTSTGTSVTTGTQDFNQGDQVTRHFAGGRVDYEFNNSNHLEFIYKRSTDSDLRTDLDTVNINPLVKTYATTDFYSAAWRWTLNPRMQNEFRAGGNLAPVAFITDVPFGSAIFGGIALVTNPVPTFQGQGRDTRTYSYADNFSWTRGNHALAFGGSYQNVRVQPFLNGFATSPTLFPLYNFGYSSIAPCTANGTCEFLGAGNFPTAISAANVNSANALRAMLSGVIGSAVQTFEVKDKTSGFVPNYQNVRDLTLNTYSFFAKDSWRIRPNLTLNYGLKWEYWTPLREDNDLSLAPVLNGKTAYAAVLDPTTTVDFVNGGFYNKDLNNFGPSFGFAWDPFSDGKTSLRGGYTMTFVNEETITVGRNAITAGNGGLSATRSLLNTFGFLATSAPAITAPPYNVPRTQADQITQLGATSAIFAIDQDLQVPYVHQLNLSIQRELPGDIAIEARYVGTLGRKLFRGVDLNQNKAATDAAFMAEFALARQNWFTCGAVTGATCPNPASSMPIIVGFANLTNSLITTPIVQNAPAALADVYVQNRLTGNPAYGGFGRFLPNSAIYVSDVIKNGSTLNYHGLQIEARRRMKNGIFGQLNYTWSKGIADTSGNNQQRFEPLLDNARPELERRISDFHVAHVVNGNLIFELPFGRGKRWFGDNNILNYVIGGWQVGSIVHWQTGAPISIFSGRGTFNRAGRSGTMTASSNLTRGEIQNLFGIFRCGVDGVVCPTGVRNGTMYFINPSVTSTNGSAVNSDNLTNAAATTFNQVFFHPTAGQVGNLGINAFTGPSQFTWDFSMAKKTKITERFNLEFRSEFFNFTNHTNWFVGDQNIGTGSSGTFGRINPSSVNVQERVIQFALKLNF